MKLELPIVWLW